LISVCTYLLYVSTCVRMYVWMHAIYRCRRWRERRGLGIET